MTEPASPTTDRVKAASQRTRPGPERGHAARGGRIVVAGLAAGASLGLVGAMSAAARSSSETAAAEPVRRVIVVDRTTADGASPAAPQGAGSAQPAPPVTMTAEPAPLPLPPPPDPQPAPPVTQSEGS